MFNVMADHISAVLHVCI